MNLPEEIIQLEEMLLKLESFHASFDYLRLRIASPKRIKNWAERTTPNGCVVGEVTSPHTIHFRNHQPEIGGLFCERIFGPIKNWQCRCGRYNGFSIDRICEVCEVEIMDPRVRRYRTGYVNLTCPITHIWYFKGIPNYLFLLLCSYHSKLSPKKLEDIIYCKESIPGRIEESLEEFFYETIETKKNELSKFYKNIQSNNNIVSNRIKPKKPILKRRHGSEIIHAALENLNLSLEIKKTRLLLERTAAADFRQHRALDKRLLRRVRVLENFFATKTNPSWMVLTNLPILPPNLRPLVELENGRLVAADVNEIYRLIIHRNQRLHDFFYTNYAPEIISVQGRRLLQEGIDSLIDNGRLAKQKMFCINDKPLKSLTEILEGKQGRFRQSLLGKRVDYSGRSVIIVGPNLRLNQCGLPYEMAKELFQPFLIHELLNTKIKPPSHNIRLANLLLKKNKPFIWRLLEKLTKKHCILLNRAPTLHRFGIQAFHPIIILGQALHLHPLVCTGFNADFDGDQMAVHLPLYESSQLETKFFMRPSSNVLSPSNGEVILKPTQDMVIGCYYLTLMIHKNKFPFQKWFATEKQALMAFYQKSISIHAPILVRYSLQNLAIEIHKEKLLFLKNEQLFETTEVLLYKIFPINNQIHKYYLITNLGIFIAYSVNQRTYHLKDLFLETTAGRLIFSINYKTLIKINE